MQLLYNIVTMGKEEYVRTKACQILSNGSIVGSTMKRIADIGARTKPQVHGNGANIYLLLRYVGTSKRRGGQDVGSFHIEGYSILLARILVNASSYDSVSIIISS
jgi:hypothetical protein